MDSVAGQGAQMLYRGFTQAELQREYSPGSMVGGDISPYLAAYRALSTEARAGMQVAENLRYGSDPQHVLDYFPAPNPAAGLHVFIHGGYWQALSQRDSAAMAPALHEQGHAFATLNYTLAPDARLGQMLAECLQALCWLGRQAETLGFDPQRVTLSGHSAGAHLVAMVLADHGQALAASGLQVTEAVLISGVYDLEPIALMSVNDKLQLTDAEIDALSPCAAAPRPGFATALPWASATRPSSSARAATMPSICAAPAAMWGFSFSRGCIITISSCTPMSLPRPGERQHALRSNISCLRFAENMSG
ncbi:alpha/beta hydrolase [Paracoccus jeotgali]|uniref:alpha/beta hydrolase n=1 Tax=Paracoccus jeotgali TaxID=2065379 RepID=UPI001CEF6A8C|nr:alpha/beta hydrolase [Paracoccus jeotgali]